MRVEFLIGIRGVCEFRSVFHAAANQVVGVSEVDTFCEELPLCEFLQHVVILEVNFGIGNDVVPNDSLFNLHAFLFQSLHQRKNSRSGALKIEILAVSVEITVHFCVGELHGLEVHVHVAEHLLNDAVNLTFLQSPFFKLVLVFDGLHQESADFLDHWLVDGKVGIDSL